MLMFPCYPKTSPVDKRTVNQCTIYYYWYYIEYAYNKGTVCTIVF